MSGHLTVRRVILSDADDLYVWRTDPVTVEASRVGTSLTFQDHLRWLTAYLDRPDGLLVIGQHGRGSKVGTVRFDARPELGSASFEVSITVAPPSRGRGLAKGLLLASEEFARATLPLKTVYAFVRISNDASLRLFDMCGYSRQGPTTDPTGVWFRKTLAG
jgi:RimJ/RimL family protein N-acetyltransferase